MGIEELGPWAPATVEEVVALFGPAPFRWWLSGGHALEAYLSDKKRGTSWRSHADIDVGIRRIEAPAVHHLLDGWDIHLASNGELTPWDGRPLSHRPERAENNLWCRPGGLRPKDTADLEVVVPELESERRSWLAEHLPSDHPWQTNISHRQGLPS